MNARMICDALGGRWHGGYGLTFCPVHQNTRTPALSVKDGDGGKLLVHCFAGCDARDVLAALRARGLLAGRSDWKPDPQKIAKRKADQDADDRRRIDIARRCWAEAGPIDGTLAERYLRRRGIIYMLPPTLKFHPTCWHGPTAAKVPAMVAGVSIGRKVVGVHRTYLAEPGVKAFDNAKLMLGCCAGGAVRLSGGPGALVVAEGIETALALLTGLHDRLPRVWAALSTSGMAGLILPTDPGEMVLAPDGDDPGRDAARKLATRARADGWRVRTMPPPAAGKDWNDHITSEAAA
jgi:hypothetical protein